MKILVTGGDGFIGCNLVNRLIKLDNEVVIYDNHLNFSNNPKYYLHSLKIRKCLYKEKAIHKYNEDIRNISKLKKAFREFKPEIVVHLAGLPMARAPKEHESSMVPINLHGTLNVLKTFENSPYTQKLIYTSSSMSYGHFLQNPQCENFPLNPINLYGATKAAGEHFVKMSKKDWVIVRPTSVYGFTDCANRVTQILIDSAIQKKKAWVVKGESLDFSYVEDVVDGFVRCIFSPKAIGQTFNISRGQSRPASEFAELLKIHFPDFEYEIKEPTNQQVWRGALDITKAKELLKFNPKYSIEKGIKEILYLMDEYEWKQKVY